MFISDFFATKCPLTIGPHSILITVGCILKHGSKDINYVLIFFFLVAFVNSIDLASSLSRMEIEHLHFIPYSNLLQSTHFDTKQSG